MNSEALDPDNDFSDKINKLPLEVCFPVHDSKISCAFMFLKIGTPKSLMEKTFVYLVLVGYDVDYEFTAEYYWRKLFQQ